MLSSGPLATPSTRRSRGGGVLVGGVAPDLLRIKGKEDSFFQGSGAGCIRLLDVLVGRRVQPGHLLRRERTEASGVALAAGDVGAERNLDVGQAEAAFRVAMG